MKQPFFRVMRQLLLCAAATAAIYGGASCHSDTDPIVSDALADVIFEGEASHEALEALLAAKPVAKPPKYASFDSPPDGSMIPSSSPIPTFSWKMTQAGTGARAPLPLPASRWAFTDLLGREHQTLAGRDSRAGLGPLLELIGPERAASAHGAPLTGAGYLVLFSTEKNDKLLRVFTSKTSYTPDAAAWGKLKAAGTTISAWILTGIFEDNEVTADGGPFEGPWIALTITP